MRKTNGRYRKITPKRVAANLNLIEKQRKIGVQRIREYVWERDNGICVYCEDMANEIDHVISVAQGGLDIKGNLVLTCRKCNVRKQGLKEVFVVKGLEHLLSKGESLEWVEQYLTLMNKKIGVILDYIQRHKR